MKHRPTCNGWLIWTIAMLLGLIGLLAIHFTAAHARDLGQWEASDQAIRKWYRELMRPDAPNSSCCGEADAYWCDDYFARGGKAYCRITDDRPDGPLGRPHVEIGTEIEIPPEKLKFDRGNPTGHSIVFLSVTGYTFCYVQGGGA